MLYGSIRAVDLNDVLKHEPLPAPLSLAGTDTTLNIYEVPQNSNLTVDGQAVVAPGIPKVILMIFPKYL